MNEADDLLFDPDLAPAKKPEPSKRWRNWWRAAECAYYEDGSVLLAGEVFWGAYVWPSKDIAETEAARKLEEDRLRGWRADDEYLGAFPEGERP